MKNLIPPNARQQKDAWIKGVMSGIFKLLAMRKVMAKGVATKHAMTIVKATSKVTWRVTALYKFRIVNKPLMINVEAMAAI